MPDERRPETELNRLWNAVQRGDLTLDSAADPHQAETLRQIHAMSLAPPPAVARARLDEGMQALLTIPANGHTAFDPRRVHVLVHVPDGQHTPRPPAIGAALPAPRPVAARFGWAAMQAATALLVLLTLGLVVLLAAPGRLDSRDVAGIRSVFAPETPATGVAIQETLFAAAVPAAALPHGDRVSGNLSHFTVAPGVASSWEPALDGCCPGLRIAHVLEGELLVRPGGPARVLRSGADLSPQSVAVGTEVVLGPGDTVMSRYEDPFESANPGDAEVRLLDWVFVDGFVTSNHGNPSGWEYHFDGHYIYDLSMADRDATVRLERVTLQPGAVLPVGGVDLAHFGLTVADDEPLHAATDGTLANNGGKPITVHVLTVTPVEPDGEGAPPAPDVTLDTIFAATLAHDVIPVAGNLDFLLWRATLDPGHRARHESTARGPQITTVLAGDLTVRADGSMRVFRAASDLAGVGAVADGSEIVLHPGDTAVYALDIPVDYANHGATPVQIVSGGLFAGYTGGLLAGNNSWLPADFIVVDYNQDFGIPMLPSGPVTATLVRATLPPAGEAPAPPGALVLDVGADGDANIARDADGSRRNIGEETATIYVLSLAPVAAADAGAAP